MTSAETLLRQSRRPFRREAGRPQVRAALLHHTTAASTPLRLDHNSFAVSSPLALLGSAFYAVRVPRLMIYDPCRAACGTSPQSITLLQLRFTSLTVVSSRWDLHPQECAHAGRTKKTCDVLHRRLVRTRKKRSDHVESNSARPITYSLQQRFVSDALFYFVPVTSISTRRSGCRQAISFGVTFRPLHSPGLVTGSAPSTPTAEILLAAIPPASIR